MEEMGNFGFSIFTIRNRDTRFGEPEPEPEPEPDPDTPPPTPPNRIGWRENYQISSVSTRSP